MIQKVALYLLFIPLLGKAQSDSTKKLSFTGYVSVYAAHDLNATPTNERPSFFYHYKRTNEVAVNLAYLKGKYETERTRVSLGLMAGTYVQYNLATEPAALRPLYEAYGGVKLSKSKNLWLDVGILPSHLGMESPEGKYQWTLSRSLSAEGSPYYESGIRLQYQTNNNKWQMGLYVLNGWQHIQRPSANSIPAFGTQLSYTPSTSFTINYSTFIGNEFPDSAQRWRYFNNIYSLFSLTKKLSMSVGFDIWFQQDSSNSSHYDTWYTPYMNLRYQLNDKWYACLRGEAYMDPDQVIVTTNTGNGFQTVGYSINIDYHITPQVLWRIEYRGFNSEDPIFYGKTDQSTSNTYNTFTTNLAFTF